jgi:hypothetical protein
MEVSDAPPRYHWLYRLCWTLAVLFAFMTAWQLRIGLLPWIPITFLFVLAMTVEDMQKKCQEKLPKARLLYHSCSFLAMAVLLLSIYRAVTEHRF